MLFARFLVALFLALPALAAAQEAFTNRATELKERGDSDARTLSRVAADTPVRVAERGNGWARIEAGGQSGWVRIFHLRFPATGEVARSPQGGGALSTLSGALGMGRDTSRRATIATTGIRGLSTEDLKNASPDAEALRRLQSYRADQASAERFAREGKLNPVQVEYEGGRR